MPILAYDQPLARSKSRRIRVQGWLHAQMNGKFMLRPGCEGGM